MRCSWMFPCLIGTWVLRTGTRRVRPGPPVVGDRGIIRPRPCPDPTPTVGRGPCRPGRTAAADRIGIDLHCAGTGTRPPRGAAAYHRSVSDPAGPPPPKRREDTMSSTAVGTYGDDLYTE